MLIEALSCGDALAVLSEVSFSSIGRYLGKLDEIAKKFADSLEEGLSF